MKIYAKEYKRSMQEGYRKFNDSFANELRQTSKSDSRKFWNILNRYSESRTDTKAISIEDLYDFFRATNSFDEIDECRENENVIFCMNDGISKELNESITEDEIRNIVKNLSNNKAGGYDRILNEYILYIKSTIDQCIHIYVKLFNLVFDSGFCPECWTVVIIKPLYENKGDPTNPENYLSITRLSCMGKVFTAILNRRLCIISEEYDILNKKSVRF